MASSRSPLRTTSRPGRRRPAAEGARGHNDSAWQGKLQTAHAEANALREQLADATKQIGTQMMDIQREMASMKSQLYSDSGLDGLKAQLEALKGASMAELQAASDGERTGQREDGDAGKIEPVEQGGQDLGIHAIAACAPCLGTIASSPAIRPGCCFRLRAGR